MQDPAGQGGIFSDSTLEIVGSRVSHVAKTSFFPEQEGYFEGDMDFLANVDVAADLNNQYKGADNSNLYNRADEIFAGRFNAGVELAQQRGGDGKLRMSVPGPIADDDMSVEGLFAKFFASLTDPTGVMPPALSGSASQGMSARTELNEDDEAELQRIVGQDLASSTFLTGVRDDEDQRSSVGSKAFGAEGQSVVVREDSSASSSRSLQDKEVEADALQRRGDSNAKAVIGRGTQSLYVDEPLPAPLSLEAAVTIAMDMAEESSTLEQVMVNLPRLALYSDKLQPPLPSRVEMSMIMQLALETMHLKYGNFSKLDREREEKQKTAFKQYFQMPASRLLIIDGFWYTIAHFFSDPSHYVKLPDGGLLFNALTHPKHKLMNQKIGRSTTNNNSDRTIAEAAAERRNQIEKVVNGARAAGMDFQTLDVLERKCVFVSVQMDQIKKNMYTRMSRNWIAMFLQVPSLYRDEFMQYYYDAYSQVLYYALSVAFPASRSMIENPDFKKKLVDLTAMWTIGFVPGNSGHEHWKSLKREPKKNTVLQKALTYSTKTKVWDLEKRLDSEAAKARRKHAHHGVGGGHKEKDSEDKEKDKEREEKEKGKEKSKENESSAEGGVSQMSQSALIATNSSFSKLDDGLFAALKKDALEAEANLPYMVVKKPTEFHHSGFIQDFLETQGYANQINRKITVPLSTTLSLDPELRHLHESRISRGNKQGQITRDLKKSLEESKKEYLKVAGKEKKLKAEEEDRIKLMEDRAKRDPTAFCKGMVKDYQDKKVAEQDDLRNYRQNKSLGGQRSDNKNDELNRKD